MYEPELQTRLATLSAVRERIRDTFQKIT